MDSKVELFEREEEGVLIAGYAWKAEEPRALVCLVHGLGEYAQRYDGVGKLFQSSNITLMAMDLRGHGRSSGTRGHTPRKETFLDIDWLVSTAKEQYPDLPLILYGHSMGGNLVLDYRTCGAQRTLLTGYLITAPWLLLQRKVSFWRNSLVRLMAKIKPEHTLNAGLNAENLGSRVAESEDTDKEGSGDVCGHGRISVQTAVECFDRAKVLLAEPVADLPTETSQPMLIMQGDADRLCVPEGAEIIARREGETCQYMELKGFPHELHIGNEKANPLDVVSAMIHWINGLT